MSTSRKWVFIFGLLVAASLVLAACAPETIVETVVVTQVVEVPGEAPPPEQPQQPAEGECCETYRIGIFEDPLTTNYWNYLGPGSSVWTQYALAGGAASLYTLSDQRFDFVPSLATDLPQEPVQEGDFYTITVPMVQDAMWSDGEPITSDDVIFTFAACLDLQLTSNWPNSCRPEIIDRVEAVDEFTVKFYFNDIPGLAQWQFGAAQGAILPEHYWAGLVGEARSFVDGVSAPEGVDCAAEDLGEADQAACDTYNEAFENARKTLYEADAAGAPYYGGYVLNQLEPGAFVQKEQNANYYFTGSRVIEYDDGTWVLEHPNGTRLELYGDASGEEILNFVTGPYSPNVVMSIYGSQDAAFLALANGEVDYVINPLSLARGLREQAERGEGVVSYTNPDNGLFYLAFNMRKAPMSMFEFRQAVDILIDKEFVANTILQGTVIPTYSIVPPGNAFWYNDSIETPYVGLSREERINAAVTLLKDAGWTWSTEPAWNEDRQDVDPGQGMRMPDGTLVPDLTILGPGPAYDPQRATFNQWISEWMRELGVPVTSELTGFNTILTPVFVEANFDLYILGWSLTIYPDYMVDFFHSRNDTAVSGNFNTPGLNNAEFDAAADEFLAETDITRAQEKAFELQTILAEQRPYIPLFVRQSIDLIRNNVQLPYTDVLGGFEGTVGFEVDAQVLSK